MEFLKTFRFLTVLPIGEHPQDPSEIGEWAWLGIPTVGLTAGIITALVAWLLGGTPAAGPITVATMAAIEGLQHLDGLLDLADATLVHMYGGDPTQALKDPRIGTGGLAAGTVTLLVTALSLQTIPYQALVPIEVFSRYTVLPVAAAGQPLPDSVSGRVFTEHVDPEQVLKAGLLSTAITIPFHPEATLVCATCSAITAYATLKTAQEVLGGVNGDALGAGIWITRALSAACLACIT